MAVLTDGRWDINFSRPERIVQRVFTAWRVGGLNGYNSYVMAVIYAARY